MAENEDKKKKNSPIKVNVSTLSKGLYLDTNFLNQPQGSYPFALNAVHETKEGERGFVSNEQSNELCGQITEGFIPIGHEYLIDNRVIVFSVNDTGTSEIGIIDENCNYEVHVSSDCLGFNRKYQIDSTFRVRLGCEEVVYFVDGYNKNKFFNFSKPENFYTTAYAAWLDNPVGTFTGEKWDCDLFSLSGSYKIPCFNSVDVIRGGNLRTGTYNFAIKYIDANLNETNWIYTSQPVPIYPIGSGAYYDTFGAENIDVNSFDGVNPVAKSIEIRLGNLDKRYTYYRIAVLAATVSDKEVSEIYYSPNILIDEDTYLFSGNLEGYTIGEIGEVSIGKSDIEVAAHIEQLENRLILSNMSGRALDFCSFQAAASQIASRYVVSEFDLADIDAVGNAKNPETYWEEVGYMGDEVYAMGIVYVFTDGYETPAYHIPGRPADVYYDFDTQQCEPKSLDKQIPSSYSPDMAHIVGDSSDWASLPVSDRPQLWQIHNTALRTSVATDDGAYGAMAYWEAANAKYSDRKDCNGNSYWGVDVCGNSLEGTPIRHHKFPDRLIEQHHRSSTTPPPDEVNLFINIELNDGQTFPPGPPAVGVTVDFDYLGVPQPTVVITPILEDELPYSEIIFTGAGDYSDITNIVIGGTVITDYTTELLTETSKDLHNPTEWSGYGRNLGIEFDNITYPHPDIVGHYFVRAERDEANRTVFDKGFGGRIRVGTESSGLNVLNGLDDNYLTFSYITNGDQGLGTTSQNLDGDEGGYQGYMLYPKMQYLEKSNKPQYVRQENQFYSYISSIYSDRYKKGATTLEKRTNLHIDGRIINTIGMTGNGGRNHNVTKTQVFDPLTKSSTYVSGYQTHNLSYNNRVQMVTFDNQPYYYNSLRTYDLNYIALKTEKDVHPALESIKYYRTHNCIKDLGDSQLVFGGDTFISNNYFHNVLLREYFDGPVGEVLAALAIVAAAIVTIATYGAGTPLLVATIALAAAGLTSAAVAATIKAMKESDLDEMAKDTQLDDVSKQEGLKRNSLAYVTEFISPIPLESEINMDLRHELNTESGNVYSSPESLKEYAKRKIMYFDTDEEDFKLYPVTAPEIYAYNLDYSRMNKQSLYFALPGDYDCCTDCLDRFPNRVHYSQQAFQEEKVDNYRVFLTGNYRDIEAEHGEITNLIRRHNNLYIHTEEALWRLPQNFQQKVVGDLIEYVGTGDFFSIPPRKVMDADIGTSGSVSKWATVKTNHGIFYVNTREGNVYLLGEGLEDITLNGMRSFFKEHLNSDLTEQILALTGYEMSEDNHANPSGVGLHATYDSRLNRVILTHKNFLILPEYAETFEVTDTGNINGRLYYDAEKGYFYTRVSYNTVIVDLTDTEFFENRSWTLSYSFHTKEWVSFHSYIPNYYIFGNNLLYSFHDYDEIWRHNVKGSYQRFYGEVAPHILEYVSNSNPLITRTWEDITFMSNAQRYVSANNSFVDERNVTFDKIQVYNSRQHSGELNLEVKDTRANPADFFAQQTQNTSGEITLDRNERNWSINDLRDIRTDYTQPIFYTDWDSIKNNYFIDKVVNTNAIDYNKSWDELESFRDKFLVLRLEFSNDEDVKLTTNFSLETEQQSFR